METLDSSNANGTPLTEEQLAYFSASTKRAVDNALRRFRRSAVAGFLILLLGVGYNLYDTRTASDEGRHAIVQSGRVVAVDGCNRDFRTIGILRAQIIKGKEQIQAYVEDGTITQAAADRQIKATDELLAKYKQPDCRVADKLLTDDPDVKRPVPKPLYPKRGD